MINLRCNTMIVTHNTMIVTYNTMIVTVDYLYRYRSNVTVELTELEFIVHFLHT
jgi:hypothetical protein